MMHARAPLTGRITLVGAGPGAADLLTVRAVRCLHTADIVFYDRLIDAGVLDLIPAATPRVFVGKEVGAHAWPQARIDAAITAAARMGQHVVRLKSGDPSILGRAGEEIAAARAHGIPVTVIPGITAASAGAARLCQPLTERGMTERVTLATATCRPGQDWAGLDAVAIPGTTIALYMGMLRLPEVTASLRRAGLDDDAPITILSCIETASEARLDTTVGTLVTDVAASGIAHPAVIYITVPQTATAPVSRAMAHSA
jgi:uroporphyrin-III C-methyltransferase